MSGTKHGAAKRDQGFTLLEMLVVLSIIAAVTAVMLTVSRPDPQNLAVHTDARAVAARLRSARLDALRENRDVRFGLDVEQRIFFVGEPLEAERLKSDAEVSVFAARREITAGGVAYVVFFADGSSTGGSVSLTAPDFAVEVSVDWMSGSVRVTNDAR